ncbi:uncharacterized protein LOC122799996 [Protopterus annectens]|uniref:uncharacterized protein LOC122799996 n=1 Tax=Protopterus annectens TaxID=7888 RepID=UPI001CFBBD14|nr:uncharacterized protein LOC122799996 [Protopterus annectens]
MTRSVSALKGQDTQLNCLFQFPPEQTYNRSVWFIHKGKEHESCLTDEPPLHITINYTERFSLAANIKNGSCTLGIRSITISDERRYCFRFYTNENRWTDKGGVTLRVKATPVISELYLKEPPNEGITNNITCKVSNVYPRESLNIALCADIVPKNETLSEQREPDLTFNVIKTVVFTPSKFHHQKYCTCNVTHSALQQPLLKTVIIEFQYNSNIAVGVGITTILLLFIIIIVLLYCYKQTKGKGKAMSMSSTLPTNNAAHSENAVEAPSQESQTEGNIVNEHFEEPGLVYSEVEFSQKEKQNNKPNEDQQMHMTEYSSVAFRKY